MSKTILVFGGNGRTGRALTRLATSPTSGYNYAVYSVIRNASQSGAIEDLGATPVILDLEQASVADLTSAIKSASPNAIIWCAGATPGGSSTPEAIDHLAAVRTFDAAAAADVKRFVHVSSMDVRDRSKPAPEWYGERDLIGSDRLWGAIGAFMEAKLCSDRELVSGNEKRGLKWTIIRPGQLTEDEGTGKCEAGRIHLGKGVSREDIGRAVLESLGNEGSVGLAFDVAGGDVDMQEAIGKVAKDRVDCFQGYF